MGSGSQDCAPSWLFPVRWRCWGGSRRRLGIAAVGSTCCKRKGLEEGARSPGAAVRGWAALVL